MRRMPLAMTQGRPLVTVTFRRGTAVSDRPFRAPRLKISCGAVLPSIQVFPGKQLWPGFVISNLVSALWSFALVFDEGFGGLGARTIHLSPIT